MIDIKINDYIVCRRGQTFFTCIVTALTDKAVKVDVAIDPIMAGGVTVFTKTCYLPKSAIILTEKDVDGIFTLKNWIIQKLEVKHHIKKYYIEGGINRYID